MKVGIVTEPLDRPRKGGLENYVKSLVKNIQEIRNERDVVGFIHYSKKSDDTIFTKAQEIMLSSKITLPKSILNVISLPRLREIDVLHIPVPTLSVYMLLLRGNYKKILTIHDLRYFHPEFIVPRERLYAQLWKLTLQLVKGKIDMIIAVSENTKKEVMEFLKVPEERIRVIYEAADEKFRAFRTKIPDYIDAPFILSDNINLPLIKIYQKLKSMGIKHKLVVNRGLYTQFKNAIERANLQKDIVIVGYVPDEELVRLYNTADLYVRWVQYEGFGLPPLEAMACGCPVIASNVASLPEVVGDAGILVAPHDIDGWTKAMYEVLTNEGLRQDLIKKGLKRAKMFSWEKTAKETYKVYEEVYDE